MTIHTSLNWFAEKNVDREMIAATQSAFAKQLQNGYRVGFCIAVDNGRVIPCIALLARNGERLKRLGWQRVDRTVRCDSSPTTRPSGRTVKGRRVERLWINPAASEALKRQRAGSGLAKIELDSKR